VPNRLTGLDEIAANFVNFLEESVRTDIIIVRKTHGMGEVPPADAVPW
jgi:hypothetical protein